MHPEKETVKTSGGTLDLYTFSVPMMHEVRHVADDLGVVYWLYDAGENDHWEHETVFVK